MKKHDRIAKKQLRRDVLGLTRWRFINCKMKPRWRLVYGSYRRVARAIADKIMENEGALK